MEVLELANEIDKLNFVFLANNLSWMGVAKNIQGVLNAWRHIFCGSFVENQHGMLESSLSAFKRVTT